MAKRRKRPKIGDALSNRTAKEFIGRNEQLALFRQNFSENLPDEDFKWIFNIHGQGGVGKTTLSQQYQHIAEKESIKIAFLDLEDSRLQNVPALLAEAVRQLMNQNIKFSKFDKKYDDFNETLKELSKDEKATPGLLSAIVSGSIKTGVSELKKVPFTGIIDHLNTDGIADKIGDYSTFLFNRFKDKGKRELMTEPKKVLATAFLEDIREYEEDVCLILDTYETAFLSLDSWLRDIYDSKFGDTPENLFLVISGRDELSEKWQKLETIIHKIPLGQFTETEAIDFLKSKDIVNEAVIKTLVEVSDRLPILLLLLSKNPPSSPEEINDVSGEAIERFLKWIKNPEERNVLLAAALPRTINQDIVEELLAVLGIDKTKCETYYNLLNKQPFVQQRGDIKAYHPVVKSQMLKHQYQTSRRKWREQHYALATYFDAEAELLGLDTLEKQYTNKKWIQLTLKATYHKLCANFDKEIPFAVERMAIHLDKTRIKESAINWGQIIFEAGQLVDEKDWSIFIQKGISAFISNDNENTITFFDKILKTNWIKDKSAKSEIYFKIGYLFRQKYDLISAIKSYKKAIELNPNNEKLYSNLGVVHYFKRNFSLAMENYQKAIELNPNAAFTLVNIGLIYLRQRKYEKAITYLNRSIKINPTHHLSYYNLGIIYRDMGEYEKANINFEKAIKINTNHNDEDFLYGLAVSYFKINNISKSLITFKKVIDINKENRDAYTNIGYIHIRQKNYVEANQYIQKAWELSGEKHDFTAKNIAHLALLQDDRKIAIEKYKAVVPLWGNLEDFLVQLESDYKELLLEEKGITKATYQEILDILKKEK